MLTRICMDNDVLFEMNLSSIPSPGEIIFVGTTAYWIKSRTWEIVDDQMQAILHVD